MDMKNIKSVLAFGVAYFFPTLLSVEFAYIEITQNGFICRGFNLVNDLVPGPFVWRSLHLTSGLAYRALGVPAS